MNNILKIESLKAELRGELDYSDIIGGIAVDFDAIQRKDEEIKNHWLTVNLDGSDQRPLLLSNYSQ